MNNGPASLALRAGLAIILAITVVAVRSPALAQGNTPKALAVIPPNKDTDLKFYSGNGPPQEGVAALEYMMSDADLVLWVAGNQFFAMDEVVGAFRKVHPGVTVGLITLPPGLLLSAIEGGGWVYDGKEYRGTPDVYASVNLGHLKKLKAAGLMNSYEVYMHNELQIMVAKGNPKAITGIDDLVRANVRTSMPNPVSEGIMQFYARKVLERHGLWPAIANGQECASCQTTERNWFTAVHHRETPERIRDDKSDAGIVWKTEGMEALRHGAQIETVELPAADSLRDEVSYAVGALQNSRHQENAESYLAFLRSDAAQDAYAQFGFVKARPEELVLKPID
ncbi:MAG: ABC transporter substrate-binding protein [Bradyrhizobium sp.]|uniref:molybdate ABC transporter substrate-binding protein n=1 Tax=Bradyrhizobium sp. TaxID=376 RepID=UPI001201FA31|nr:substrate-binding domain-containing protein [Bradyrhizobium sp.]THD59583.1 MAG: ABC transporter substrate-binding protein [Bradyrhizobium sp.]